MGRRKADPDDPVVRVDMRVRRSAFPELYRWIEKNQLHAVAVIRVALESALVTAGGSAGIGMLTPDAPPSVGGVARRREAAVSPGQAPVGQVGAVAGASPEPAVVATPADTRAVMRAKLMSNIAVLSEKGS